MKFFEKCFGHPKGRWNLLKQKPAQIVQMKHTSSSPPAEPDTATPSIAEQQETNNYWPESQCQQTYLFSH